MRFAPFLTASLRAAQFDGQDGEDNLTDYTELVERAEGDLGEANLTDEQLSQLQADLEAAYDDVRPNATSAADVEALTRMMNALEGVRAEGTRREDAATARQEELAALDAVRASTDDDAGDGDGSDGEGDGDGDGSEDDENADGDADGGEGDGSTGAGAEGEGEGDAEGAADRLAASSGGTPPPRPAARPSLRGMRGSGRRHTPPARGEGGGQGGAGIDPASRMTASAAVGRLMPSLAGGDTFGDQETLGEAISTVFNSLARVPEPNPNARHYIGTIPMRQEGPRFAAADQFDSVDDAIDGAVARLVASRRENARLVASGGECAVPEPDYSITLVGDEGTDFVQQLPTVTGKRPISFYPWVEVDMTSAANRRGQFSPANGDDDNDAPDPFDATGHVTAEADAAGYVSSNPAGPTPDKDCLHMTCMDPKELGLGASYKCTTVGNFQAEAFPEFVAMFEKYARIGFDDARDRRAQSIILDDDNTKIVTGEADFGAAVELLAKIRRLAAGIRSVRRARNLPIDVFIPEFAADMVAQDIATTMFGGLESLRITAQQAIAILGVTENIFVNTYRASWGTTSGGSPTILPKQGAGALLDWPEEIRIGVWPTGGVFQKTGWQIAFGLKEVGMATNDASAFMELAENTGTRSSDLYILDVEMPVNGVRGGSVVLDAA